MLNLDGWRINHAHKMNGDSGNIIITWDQIDEGYFWTARYRLGNNRSEQLSGNEDTFVQAAKAAEIALTELEANHGA